MMEFQAEIKQRIEEDLARGAVARQEGQEGRARVCARRAAGVAIRAYLEARGPVNPGLVSAYDLIAYLRDYQGFSPEIREVAGRLVARVTPSFDLPLEADLLADARWLVDKLEAELEH